MGIRQANKKITLFFPHEIPESTIEIILTQISKFCILSKTGHGRNKGESESKNCHYESSKISEFLFYRKQDMVETKEKVKVKTN